MKKMVASFLIFAVLAGLAYVPLNSEKSSNDAVTANELPALENIQIGEHIQLGKYNNEPIIWQYVADDENGKLILSDKILCVKTFGKDNFWQDSFIRKWLNSTAKEGEVDWLTYFEEDYVEIDSYRYEKGFLNKDNFSAGERNIMKTVTQWTMLPENHLDLSVNGNTERFNPVMRESMTGNPADITVPVCYDVRELPNVYFGAAHQITDTIFLLDEMQLYHLWENFGVISPSNNNYTPYALRSPSSIFMNIGTNRHVGAVTRNYYTCEVIIGIGIRPAFYLNEENAVILSGSGTEEDPYVLDGKENGDISVYCNEEKLWFDQPPIMENNRVLVPMRFIFEALGAAVDWNGETQTVTAVCGDTNISLQIDRQEMYVNGEMKWLDVPARLLNDRTLVPIRAVSEAMEAKVEWIQEDKTVVITTQ